MPFKFADSNLKSYATRSPPLDEQAILHPHHFVLSKTENSSPQSSMPSSIPSITNDAKFDQNIDVEIQEINNGARNIPENTFET